MVASLALVGGCGAMAPGVSEEVVAVIEADVDAFLEKADPYGKVRAVLVHHGGEPVLETYIGADKDDTWDTRSVTKSVMSALIGIAIDEGHIDGVDATLGELLPSYGDVMTREVADITLEEVLTHTGGFAAGGAGAGTFPFWEAPDWVRAILERRVADGPGDGSFTCSDAGSHLLAAILVEATGTPVLDYARENLLEPIGIDSDPAGEAAAPDSPAQPEFWEGYNGAGFAWPTDPQGHHWGDCCLKVRPADLARLGALYLDGGAWDGRQVVPASWVEQSTTAHVESALGGNDYGYQWWVTQADGSPAHAAMGRGGQLIEVVPERDLVVVVATEFDELDPLADHKAVDPASLLVMVSLYIAPHVDEQR